MLDLLMKRRSIRRFEDKKIDPKIIDNIIQGALTSPTGRNRRPWEVIVVRDKEILRELGESRGVYSAHMKDAGVGFVIAANPQMTDIWIEDTSVIATIIQLTAQSYGLGSCWIQVRERITDNNVNLENKVKEILNIPSRYRVECMLAVGYSAEEKKAHDKNLLNYGKVHFDKF